jgi:ATP-dependent RNA helicase SUPV3L1/SUV3
MVASDAIGMGLNLKIKRIIFTSVTKWNGSEMVPISTSQLKQIAGRAGRYGTAADGEKDGGFATTLHDKDLDVLIEALAAPLIPITRAGLTHTPEHLAALVSTLPTARIGFSNMSGKQRGLPSLLDDLTMLSQIDSRNYFASSLEQQLLLAPFLEKAVPAVLDLTIQERELFAISPANARDERLLSLLANMVGYYARGELVSFEQCDQSLDMLGTLETVSDLKRRVHAKLREERQQQKDNADQSVRLVEDQQEDEKESDDSVTSSGSNEHQTDNRSTSESGDGSGSSSSDERSAHLGRVYQNMGQPMDIYHLLILESLHRGLNLYLWFSLRLPLAFCYRAQVEVYKKETEDAVDFCLEAIKAGRVHRLNKMNRQNNAESQDFPDSISKSSEAMRLRVLRKNREGRPQQRGNADDRFGNQNQRVSKRFETDGQRRYQRGDYVPPHSSAPSGFSAWRD